MAILPGVPHISITVVIDGVTAQECQCRRLPRPIYLDGGRELRQARYYIESQDRKEYSIQCSVSRSFPFLHDTDTLIISVLIDGQPIAKRVVSKTQIKDCDVEYIEEIDCVERKLEDGSSKWYHMVFEEVISVEEADQKTTEDDLRRIKTSGIIQVAVSVAKEGASPPIVPSLDHGKRNGPLAFSQKILALYHLEKSHGTRYLKIDDDCAPDPCTVNVQDIKLLGQVVFIYMPHDVLNAKGLLNPGLVNNDTLGMRLSTQVDRVSVTPDGSPLAAGGQS